MFLEKESGNSSTHKLSTVWESTFTICVHLNPVLITPHWKELWSCNLCRSAPLEMLFSMKSFFAVVKIFRIWLKTMDYSPWFELWGSKKSLEERIPSERASQGEQNDKISTSQHLPVSIYLHLKSTAVTTFTMSVHFNWCR